MSRLGSVTHTHHSIDLPRQIKHGKLSILSAQKLPHHAKRAFVHMPKASTHTQTQTRQSGRHTHTSMLQKTRQIPHSIRTRRPTAMGRHHPSTRGRGKIKNSSPQCTHATRARKSKESLVPSTLTHACTHNTRTHARTHATYAAPHPLAQSYRGSSSAPGVSAQAPGVGAAAGVGAAHALYPPAPGVGAL